MQIKFVTVIGANGTMGRNIAGVLAYLGNARVYLLCRSKEKAYEAIKFLTKIYGEKLSLDNLLPVDYSMIDECIRKSDLVFESVSEDMTTKKDILKSVSLYLPPEACLCTGTSGFSVNKLAEDLPLEVRKRFFGVHLYNPPNVMSLCELVPNVDSNEKLLNNIQTYLESTLKRNVVIVKDTPAFIGNRIGFQFLNKALILAERYKDKGGVDYIDSILGVNTGRSMSPIATSDFVGLDVHKSIVNNIYQFTNDYERQSFSFPELGNHLIMKGSLGRKSGGGLYKSIRLISGEKQTLVYDINSDSYREVVKYDIPFLERMNYYLNIVSPE